MTDLPPQVPGTGWDTTPHADRTIHADVCVIGAGAGGAVAAAELAEGGAEVVVLEQGHRHDPDGFTARPPQMLARLYRDGGQTLTLGNPPILLPLGSGVGGTTLVNSGTCFRTPPSVLERWRREFGLDVDEESLRPCFERVEQALSVAEVTPELAGNNTAVARRGAEQLGWSHGYLRRNARGCVGSGVCAFGCPTSAKQHTGITYVPRAQRAGARIVTGASVERIAVESGRASGAHARMASGARVEVRAPVVILAAGTIHTPLLLERSGLGGRSGQLGRNLSLHPATAAFARMEEIVDMARGVPQSFFVDEFADQGILFEGVAGPPSYAAMSLPLTGERHAEAMADYRHLAQFGLMVSDSSRGSVRSIGGRTVIRYDLTDADLERFRMGLARMRELLLAAGAREVYLPLPPGVEPERARAHQLKLMAFHPLGTARADARPDHGVIDGDLRLHDTTGLYVADGSAVPSSLGVNPQMTIMALATRLAFHLREEEVPCPS
ncbi:MAG TPA: GMC family oxidoreductase [Solirubrobacteraceae bacterium]|jgi:choline dehydrogenase-like flavoprotein|nr:GMC family oxidoreductase [Solirubrobacteraceae bacterium]